MKTVLITGSTDGIGKQTALELAGTGCRVIVHGRSIGKCKSTCSYINSLTGNNNVGFIVADLDSLEAIEYMAKKVKRIYGYIDILINNAGVFEHKKILTKDGFERTFAVNYLSGFLLSGLLIKYMKNDSFSRIINVSSMAHSDNIDFKNLNCEKYYDGFDAYGRSKLCNILFTFELANRLKSRNITVNCLHPGVINTKLLHVGWGIGGASLHEGAKTSVYLATSDEVENVTGEYFSDRCKSKPAKICYDKKVREKLWKISEHMCNFEYDL